MAELLLDVGRLVHRTWRRRLPTGIDRVCLAYVERWQHEARAVLHWRGMCVVLDKPQSRWLFHLLLNPGPGHRRALARAIVRAVVARRTGPWEPGSVYLNLGHLGVQHEGLRHWVRRWGLQSVCMVHDLIPLSHPEYCRPGEEARHLHRMRALLQLSSGVLTNSQATADELACFAQQQGLSLPPVRTALLAPAALPRPAATALLGEPYFVVLGTLEPRKNHLLLLQLWREMVQALGAQAPHLVLIGQRGWECENVVDLLDRCPALRARVHEWPRCPDAELATWLRHARALLFPSFVEGYGMPLVEALAVGTPVIASDLAVFREVAGEVPDYLHPLDAPAWRRAILSYAQAHSPARQAQLERLAHWRAPTWTAHFEAVERLLGQLAPASRAPCQALQAP